MPLVEEGWHDDSVTETVARRYLKPLLSKHIDTLVLGCTHYPLLKKTLQRVVGPRVALIDSAEETAHDVEIKLGRDKIFKSQSQKRDAGLFRHRQRAVVFAVESTIHGREHQAGPAFVVGRFVSEKAIVLLSGGLDSAVSLWWAMKKGWRCVALGFDYGQRHHRETAHAKKIARLADVPYQTVRFDLPWSRSSLTDRSFALPRTRAAENIPTTIPSTYVPGRNDIVFEFRDVTRQIKSTQAQNRNRGERDLIIPEYPDCRGPYLERVRSLSPVGARAWERN